MDSRNTLPYARWIRTGFSELKVTMDSEKTTPRPVDKKRTGFSEDQTVGKLYPKPGGYGQGLVKVMTVGKLYPTPGGYGQGLEKE